MHRSSRSRRLVVLQWRDVGHPDGGGSEVFVDRVTRQLAADGWDVTVCCAAYPGAPRDEVRDGVRLRRRGGRLTVYLHGLAYLLTRRGRRADVVLDVQNGLPFASPLVRRGPVVVLLHHVHREQWQIIYPGLLGRVGWFAESRLAPRLYRRRPYLTVSDATRRSLGPLGIEAGRVAVVHNGIDVPHPDHVGVRAPNPTICVLGRLVPHKQVEHVLEAAVELRAAFPALRVEVVGDGWWRERLVEHAAALGVTDCVEFLGSVPDHERDAALDRAWVMVMPSVKEGWGIAIMEAAARGVPAVAYRSAGGVAEAVVDGETGWLVDDRAELVKRTEELLRDDELAAAMGRAARERAADFSWDTTAARVGAELEAALRR